MAQIVGCRFINGKIETATIFTDDTVQPKAETKPKEEEKPKAETKAKAKK